MHRTEGSLRVAGIDADTLRGVNQLRRKASLGFFDNVNEVEHVLSVHTVTAAELSIAGKPANRAATQEFLRTWGLDGVSRSNIESLTSYDYHLLGIALGMAWDPELLAVSDVERDLTEHQSLKLVDVLRGIAREKGVCVVCGVTDYDLAQNFDTVTCLTDTARAQQAAYLRKHGSVVEGQNAGRNGRANRDERAA
jgi:ABC-type branched-subunit amino acid transport system ATPase component